MATKEYMPPGLTLWKIGNKKEPVQGPKDNYVTTLYHKILGGKNDETNKGKRQTHRFNTN